MMFKRIAHVCLNTSDLERSVAWYEKLDFGIRFRFTRKGSQFGVYMVVAEGTFVEIFEDPNLGPVVNNGIAHFCLETDDIDAVVEKLTERGIAVTPKKLGVDNTWQVWLEDPDGNRFEVHQYTAASTQFSGGTVEADW
jgi:catechol 2,3-dioxygenase-like lactoylglutathione lyase family enzyme